MAAQEVNYSMNSAIERQDDTETREVLGAFVLTKADNNGESSSVLTSLIEEQQSSMKCIEVGKELAGIAHEIDFVHDNSIQDLMVRVGTPDLAFETFRSVARQLFSWDTRGGQIGNLIVCLNSILVYNDIISLVRVTWRRIAALLGFCYSLCRNFLFTTNNVRSLKAFFNAVVGYLTRFLSEGQLLNWIRSQGGWVS